MESSRFLNASGLSIHIVDYSDHYARVDSLSRFNFLTYSENEWKKYNSKFQYVNHLRHSECLVLLEKSGFKILEAEPDIEPSEQEILKNLADQFKKFKIADLFATWAKIVA